MRDKKHCGRISEALNLARAWNIYLKKENKKKRCSGIRPWKKAPPAPSPCANVPEWCRGKEYKHCWYLGHLMCSLCITTTVSSGLDVLMSSISKVRGEVVRQLQVATILLAFLKPLECFWSRYFCYLFSNLVPFSYFLFVLCRIYSNVLYFIQKIFQNHTGTQSI